MLAIFGTGSKTKHLGKISSEPCENCKCSSYDYYNIFDYAHFFFIPLISAGKKDLFICSNCNKVYENKQLSDIKRQSIKTSHLKSSTPISCFTGSIIFIALLVIIFTFSFLNRSYNMKSNHSKLTHPVVGDFYIIKDFNSKIFGDIKDNKLKYYPMKLDKYNDSGYYFLISNYVYSFPNDAKINIINNNSKKDYFFHDYLVFQKDKLSQLIDSDNLEIKRDSKQ
jgi:hypothetical protein